MIIRVILMHVLSWAPWLLFSQADPAFLLNRTPCRHLTHDIPLPGGLNPAVACFGTRLCWEAVVTNHFGISDFNTLQAGVAKGIKNFALGLELKHSEVGGLGYSRTLGSFRGSLRLSEKLDAGLSLMVHRIRLPEDYGKGINVGGAAGFLLRPSSNLAFGMAAGYLRAMNNAGEEDSPIALLSADLRLRLKGKTYLSFSGEMVSLEKPSLLVSVVLEPVASIRIAAGLGNGRELITVGISYDFGKINAGAASCFNPSAGNTYSLFATGEIRYR